MQSNSEFDLHVWKQRAEGDHEERFTIGIWDKGRIVPLCHIEPLEKTLVIIRGLLESAARPACETPAANAI